MTSTPVKEIGSALLNLTLTQAGRSAANTGGFQQVWNNQMSRGNTDGAEQENMTTQSGTRLQRGSSLKAKETRPAPEREGEMESVEELSSGKQEQVLEVLNVAAQDLMEQIADVFGISMEELQSVMDDLGLEQMDLLDASQLGSLLLNLGGASDACALVTDGELYEKYRALMEQLDTVIQESADTLDMEPELLTQLVKTGLPKESMPVEPEMVPNRQETVMSRGQEPAEGEDVPVVNTAEVAVEKEQDTENQGNGQMKGQEQHGEGRSEKGQDVNPFVQDFRTVQFQPEFQQTQSVSQNSPWSESTQAIMDQILDYMKIQVSADTTSLEMQLHPASLGTLQVQISAKAGVMTANFITQNETVKAALESQMVQLKEQFEEQGVKVEAIEVTVQTHEFERNLDEQGRGRNQQEPEKKNRARRIQLGDTLTVDSPEEGDGLTSDRMTANGSTVEYTA